MTTPSRVWKSLAVLLGLLEENLVPLDLVFDERAIRIVILKVGHLLLEVVNMDLDGSLVELLQGGRMIGEYDDAVSLDLRIPPGSWPSDSVTRTVPDLSVVTTGSCLAKMPISPSEAGMTTKWASSEYSLLSGVTISHCSMVG